ncbi:hypothetical protein H0H93_013153 [Arthromyces matolae]|nr:hypothetical protein H0H93_013153 [Arthromyces matolae]
MHTRRVLSHFTVALFLVALVSLHVTSAYPIHDPPLVHRPKDKEASPGPSTTPTSSAEPPTVHDNPSVAVAKPESPPDEYADCFVNAKGLRRKKDDHGHPGETIWDPATHAVPLKIQPKWLDFQIGDCPELKPSNDPERLQFRASVVETIQARRSELKQWLENKLWLQESYICSAQSDIGKYLLKLTMFERKEASPSGLAGYEPVIRNRMLTLIQMEGTTLPWETWNRHVQEGIESTLRAFAVIMSKQKPEKYDRRRNIRLQNLDVLTQQVISDVVNEENQRTADIHTHS